jgi:PAS domain S-box-containing protein
MKNKDDLSRLSSDEIYKIIYELESANEKLQISNLRMSSYFDNAPDGVFICDENSNYIDVNPASSLITGYSKEELLTMSIKDLTPEDTLETAFNQFTTLKETGSSNAEMKFLHKSGEIRWWDVSAVKLTETSYLGFVKDITERKLNKEALIQSEKRLNMIFQTLSEGVALNEIVYDDSGEMIDYKILDVNDAYFKIANYNKDIDVIGNFATKLYKMDPQFIKYFWDNHKDKITPVSTEYFDPISNKYYIISTSPFIDNKFVTSFYDITTRKEAEKKLAINKQRLKDAQSVAKIGSWETDLNTFEVIWSDETYNIFELNQNDFSNSHPNFLNYVHPDDRANVDSALLNSFSSYDINKVEHRIIIPSNKLKIVEETWRVFHDSDGKAIKALGTCQDITERKKVEEKIKESEVRFKSIANNGNTLIWMAGLDKLCYYFNNPWLNFTGRTLDQEMGNGWAEGVHPEDLNEYFEIYVSAFDKHEKFEMDYRLKHNSGEYRWIRDIGNPNFNIDGEFIGYIGHCFDITDRKLTEEKIREKDIQFKKLSANIPDLIYQFTRRPDGSYFVPIASEGIKNIFGCTPEDVVDDFAPIAKVIYPEDLARVISDIEYSAKNLTYFTCEFRVQIPDKPIQWLFSRSNPEKLADGNITWYGFNADITERKKAELEIIKAKDKAEESDRLKTSFLANMSHEIRTPMNGILGFTNLLKEPNLTGEDKDDFIDMIERSGARMLSTINDVIDISKIEAGLIEVSISNTNINEQIEHRYSFFLPEANHKGLTLTYHSPLNSADAIIKTDNDKLYAILTNLIKNAIKFTSEGSIDFGYELKSDFIEFYVKDTGDGIDKEKLELIFERFRQGSESLTRDYEGSGLGLTISKAYVQMLGGKIWLKSELGKGTEFYFTIPYVNVKKNINTNINIMKIQAFEKDFRKLNILIAEDDETSQILLTMTLKNHTGNLIIAKNGVQAVEACRNHPDLDVILMDIKMPIMNGYEATKQIREFNKDILILGQSAYALTGDKELALSVGLNEYMTKPLDIYSLIELLYKYFKD